MIPNYQAIMLPLLKALEDEQEYGLTDVIQKICTHFKISDDEKQTLLSSGQPLIRSRVSWAKTYLQKARLITTQKKGFYKITADGLNVLKSEPTIIDNSFLMTIPEFKGWFESSRTKNDKKGTVNIDTIQANDSPSELLEDSFIKLKKALAEDLIEEVKKRSPQFFEWLVIDLLIAMGYGVGSRKEAGAVLGKSGDGGIDGVIKEDKLGLDTIYIQAKKWDNTVPISAVRDFAGALLSKKSKKGIFICTSDYPGSAYKFVKEIEHKIALIDGDTLANLMIEHNVGVSIKATYNVKEINSDYFEE